MGDVSLESFAISGALAEEPLLHGCIGDGLNISLIRLERSPACIGMETVTDCMVKEKLSQSLPIRSAPYRPRP
jgi:hypothetical protein